MKYFRLLIILPFLFVACQQQAKNENHNHNSHDHSECLVEKDGIFIHISKGYNDPHRVVMGLKMADLMSNDKDVLVYLDIDAVNFLIEDSEDINFDEFESAHTYINRLVKNGVGVYAWPGCLKVAGYKPEELMKGVKVAEKDKFFNFTKGRILSIDY